VGVGHARDEGRDGAGTCRHEAGGGLRQARREWRLLPVDIAAGAPSRSTSETESDLRPRSRAQNVGAPQAERVTAGGFWRPPSGHRFQGLWRGLLRPRTSPRRSCSRDARVSLPRNTDPPGRRAFVLLRPLESSRAFGSRSRATSPLHDEATPKPSSRSNAGPALQGSQRPKHSTTRWPRSYARWDRASQRFRCACDHTRNSVLGRRSSPCS
jgi:hypothetical protein